MTESDRRSELFLSCDLVGSTALKQRVDGGWEEAFLGFYINFPQILGEVAIRREIPFRLWKPIGDELVFRVLVKSEKDIFRAVRAWLEALDRYEGDSRSKSNPGGFKTKGGAFVGTFPGPDVEASVLRDPKERVSTVKGLAEINDEALAAGDHDRHIFDFFGPSFDTGFRVVSQSTPRHFTMSVEVAWAMLRAADELDEPVTDLAFMGPTELKGVWGGRDYPLFALDRQHADKINAAMRDFAAANVNYAKAKALLSECVKEETLPTRLFLPGSSLGLLKKRPPDALSALRGSKMDDGLEAPPDDLDSAGEGLPETLALGDETEPVEEGEATPPKEKVSKLTRNSPARQRPKVPPKGATEGQAKGRRARRPS